MKDIYGLEDKDYIYPERREASHCQVRCKNHPHLRWDTKNITPIGCRNIRYYPADNNYEPECNCPISDLERIPRETETLK